MIDEVLNPLVSYVIKQKYKGYDPYDILNSILPLKLGGRRFTFLVTQLHKKNPINIRPLLGVKKDLIPKGIGLFLHAFSLLYKKSGEREYLKQADFCYDWLIKNSARNYSGYCWGLNYDYSNAQMTIPAYSPSTVVTALIFRGIYEYYTITKSLNVKNVLESIGEFIRKDIPVTHFDDSLCISYTPFKRELCYNANALGSMVFSKLFKITGIIEYKEIARLSINYSLQKQQADGSWMYSEESGIEKNQIDFHQGFILDCLEDYILCVDNNERIKESLVKGLDYYYKNQFEVNGRSIWRVPQKWPVDIHNQTQGIITFSWAVKYNEKYSHFSKTILDWTLKNMYSGKGFFYYRVTRFYKNKISYMRWSQAWMLLAFAFYKMYNEDGNKLG